MFIRAHRKERTDKDPDGAARYMWVFRLAKSERVEGRPRQRHVAYLGTCPDSPATMPYFILSRGALYERVRAVFKRLSLPMTAEIMLPITSRVPMPSAAEIQRAQAQERAERDRFLAPFTRAQK